MIKFLYPKADKVVCVSKGIEHILKKDYDINNTKIIYNFLDMEIVKEKSKANLPDQYGKYFQIKFYIY